MPASAEQDEVMTAIADSARSAGAQPERIHRLVELADGTPVLLGGQVAGDRRLLAELFGGLSAHSRLMRFMAPISRVPEHTVDMLGAVDGVSHVGLLAVHGGRLAGAARYVRSAERPAEADVALTVADEFQRRGLGRLLFASLRDHAASHGVTRFTADMLDDNRAARAILISFGARLRSAGGQTSAVVAVTAAPVRARRAGDGR
jgi:GNAT superfamily N-acetyltransferase